MLTVQERVLYETLKQLAAAIDEKGDASHIEQVNQARDEAVRVLEIFSVLDNEPGYPNRVPQRPYPRYPQVRAELRDADLAKASTFGAVREVADAMRRTGLPDSCSVAMTFELSKLEYGHVLRGLMNYVWVGPGECPQPELREGET